MHLSCLTLAIVLHCVDAQQFYTQLFGVNWPVYAYVLASERNGATTYLMACNSGTDLQSGNCDFVQPYTLIQGPSTVAFNYTGLGGIGSVTNAMSCGLMGTTYLDCTISGDLRYITGVSTNQIQEFIATATWTGTQAAIFFSGVPVATDSASLLTYTPAGATITGLTTVFTSSYPLPTTSPPTSTASSTSTSGGAATKTTMGLGRIFGAGLVFILVYIIF